MYRTKSESAVKIQARIKKFRYGLSLDGYYYAAGTDEELYDNGVVYIIKYWELN